MTNGSKRKAMAGVTGQKFVPGGDDDGVLGQEGDDVYSIDFSAEQSLIAKSKATISGGTQLKTNFSKGTQLQTNFGLNKDATITSVNNESASDSKIAETQEKIGVEMALSTPEDGDGRLEAQSLRAASAKSAPGIAEAVKHQEKVWSEPSGRMEELGGPGQGRRLDAFKDIVVDPKPREIEQRVEQARLLQEELQNDKKRFLELPTESKRESKRMHTAEEEEKKKKFDEGDSVCFVCFDGGDSVLCDRKSCSKAYHLSCIGRDEAFFKKKGAWLCGWHFCSVCAKPGDKNFWQCYTCPTAYCGTCMIDAQGVQFLTLRERKGLCADCLPIVSMIERNETVNADGEEVNFDDHETYECLFKEYWQDLKRKLLLVIPEFDKGKNSMDEDHEAEEKSMDEDHAGNEEKLGTPEFAAITPRNIDLIYLRRALLRELLDDPEFHNKVVGTFVRIRVPGTYRLVLVTGTRMGEVSYKAGTKTTNIVLEVLNLQKKEEVTVNVVSDQDFTEEECERLRQSIKYGFIKALTVGQVEDKVMALREDKLNHWFESEKQRLSNLRDRASEKGRKKELRECVEKLEELSNPRFRAAKFEEAMPEVTSDPHMDPAYESDSKLSPDDVREKATRSGFNTSEITSSFHERGNFAHHRSRDSWEDHGHRGYYDEGRRSENLRAGRDSALAMDGKYQSIDRGVDDNWGGKGGRIEVDPWVDNWGGNGGRDEVDAWVDDSNFSLGEAKAGSGETRPDPIVGMSETEKMWHYQDPTGMVQGPFPMEQLRNWNTRGLFPADLTVWKTGEGKENSEVLLTDALAGRFKEAGRFEETLVKVEADGESGKSRYGRRSSGREDDAPVRARDGSRSARVRQRALERKDVPCRYYARGYCKRGDVCEFRHT